MSHLLPLLLFALAAASSSLSAAENWSQPQSPVRLYGHSYYVGSAGIAVVLIDSGDGLILIDGSLPQNAPMIEANLRTLGFKPEDIKYVLNSHAHFDHAGAIAQLASVGGATVVASPSGIAALRAGRPVADDPQAADAQGGFPAVTTATRAMADGEVLRLGRAAITAHYTPGHTPGSTTWTWRDCEGTRCLNLVFGDSITAVSSPGFHFLADATHADLTPRLRNSIAILAGLPCDILVPAHADRAGFDQRLQRATRGQTSPNPFIAPQACREYAAGFSQFLEQRIAREKAAAGTP